jgi:N-acetyl-alpha-D-muramate 1-phosphate uridylyltransferase
MIPVAILAGGLAKRLHPITKEIPKALVDISGIPFICRQLEYLQNQGIKKVVLCIGHLGEMIQRVVGDGSQFGIDVSYSFDGSKLLGTGGALKQALPILGEHFFILYGDSFLPVDYLAIEHAFYENNSIALMTVLKNEDRWDKSNVLFKNNQIIEYNKHYPRPEMSFVDYGLGLLSREVFDTYPSEENFGLDEVYNKLSLQGSLFGLEVYKRFYEIGSHNGLKETEAFFIRSSEI